MRRHRGLAGRARADRDVLGRVVDPRHRELLLTVDHDIWAHEAALIKDHLDSFGAYLPKELWEEYQALLDRLG